MSTLRFLSSAPCQIGAFAYLMQSAPLVRRLVSARLLREIPPKLREGG